MIWDFNNNMINTFQIGAVCLAVLASATTAEAQDEQVAGSLNRSQSRPLQRDDTTAPAPSSSGQTIARPAGFVSRSNGVTAHLGDPRFVQPEPVKTPNPRAVKKRKRRHPHYQSQSFDPRSTSQEYVFDGSDQGSQVQVDQSFEVSGLDIEDTVAHFDTLDGQRIVTATNRVAIYAPQFGAVRRIDGLVNAQSNQAPIAFVDKQQTVQASEKNRATSTKQFGMSMRSHGSSRASGILDQTRGVTADRVLHLRGARNYLQLLYANSVLEINGLDNVMGAQLQQGIQSAVAWETDLGLRVVSQGIQPIIVRDLRTAHEALHIESEDQQPTLRVVKVADKIAAHTGEEVEFTLRFDNISNRPIGNVTLLDNLTRRLEYIEESSECNLKSQFLSELNPAGALLLRWEITDPIQPSTGGVIRFRCRVR